MWWGGGGIWLVSQVTAVRFNGAKGTTWRCTWAIWPTWMEMFLNSVTWGIWEYRNSPTKQNASLPQVFPAALEHVCHLQEGIHNGAKLLFQERKTIAKLNLQDLQILSLRYSPTMSPLCFKDPNKLTGCHFIHNTFPTQSLFPLCLSVHRYGWK